MRVEVLGCDGSITGGRRTVCYKVDDDVLIDAGTGAGDLSLEQAVAVRAVFLTHAHLDHCCLLPMLADAAEPLRAEPLAVHALPETLDALRRNIFNGEIYPDYTMLPEPQRPYIRFEPMRTGETVELGGRRFTALPARHAVPCSAYRVDNGAASWVYSGDTTLCEAFWRELGRIDNLRHLLIETTLRNAQSDAAQRSGHMTAELLARGVRLLPRAVELHIVHMEAGHEDETVCEVMQALGEFHPHMLRRGDVLEL